MRTIGGSAGIVKRFEPPLYVTVTVIAPLVDAFE